MKKYTKLPIPENSAWDRRTWRYYAPIWLNKFLDSCENLIDWLPVIWKDRHWDDYYITEVLRRKIELQRKYLVKANRHTRIEEDNYWMTVVLNLIEREHESYYEMEYLDYVEYDTNNYFGSYKSEHLQDYLDRYPNDVRRARLEFSSIDLSTKPRLALWTSIYRQKKCRSLLFEILKQKSTHWWD